MQSNIFVIWLFVVSSPWTSAEAEKRLADDDDTNESLVGTPARRGAFPNVGAILFDGRHICGATLIDTNHVLTGADCVSFLFGADKSSELAKLRVYLNTVALKTYNPGAVISNVLYIKFHELYDRKTKANNIALLTLETNVTTLYPLSLPLDGTTDDYVGKNGTILRWGAAKSASTSHKILLQTPVSIISNSECSSKYSFKIADNSLCASSGSQEGITCNVSLSSNLSSAAIIEFYSTFTSVDFLECDDSSGGPVIIEGRQIGVMSWGKGCMDFNYPGIYMRISSFMNWIKSNLITNINTK